MIFTAHSLPARVAESGDPYPTELRATAEAVAARSGWPRATVGARVAERGPHARAVAGAGHPVGDRSARRRPTVDGVLVCACGFVADHLEVLYDLDIEPAGGPTPGCGSTAPLRQRRSPRDGRRSRARIASV